MLRKLFGRKTRSLLAGACALALFGAAPSVANATAFGVDYHSAPFALYVDQGATQNPSPSTPSNWDNEVPPPVLAKGGWWNYGLSGADSYTCQTGPGYPGQYSGYTGNLKDATSWNTRVLCNVGDYTKRLTSAETITNSKYWSRCPSGTGEPGCTTPNEWRRNYQGAYSGVQATIGGAEYILTFNHAENSNERRLCLPGDHGYPTQVPGHSSEYSNYYNFTCGSEYYAVGDAQANYHGLITESAGAYNASSSWGLTPYKDANGADIGFGYWDIGVVAWPVNGYFSAGGPLSSALRHPSSIKIGGYVYVYYLEQGTGNGLDGIKVVRAPEGSTTDTHAWQAWNGTSWGQAVPSDISSGYNGSTMNAHWGEHSPTSAAPLRDPSGAPNGLGQTTYRFSVAHIANCYCYVGVAYQEYGNAHYTQFYYSTDLVHWSTNDTNAKLSHADSEGDYYPLFLSADGTSNTELSSDGWAYVYGRDLTNGGYSIKSVHFALP